jgi:hypothetical protein
MSAGHGVLRRRIWQSPRFHGDHVEVSYRPVEFRAPGLRECRPGLGTTPERLYGSALALGQVAGRKPAKVVEDRPGESVRVPRGHQHQLQFSGAHRGVEGGAHRPVLRLGEKHPDRLLGEPEPLEARPENLPHHHVVHR